VHCCDPGSIDAVGRAANVEQGSSTTRRPNGLTVHPFAAYVIEASRRFSVPEHWMRAVMRVESDGKQRAPSKKSAMGVTAGLNFT
jgi:soluble lytic murein transglycosylase-like protein